MNEKEKRFRELLFEKAPERIKRWGKGDVYLAHFAAKTAEEKRAFNLLWNDIGLTDVLEYEKLITTEYEVWGDIWIYPGEIHIRSAARFPYRHGYGPKFSLDEMKALVESKL